MAEHYTKTKVLRGMNELICSYFDFTCQLCDKKTNDLIIHHIKPLEMGGKNHWINITVLCKKCHKITHKILFDFYGRENMQKNWALKRELKKKIVP